MFFRPILQRFSNLKWNMALVVGLGLLGGLATIAQAVLLAGLVNQVFLQHLPLGDCWLRAEWFLIIVAIRGAAVGLSDKVASNTALRVKTELRALVTKQLFRLGPVYLRTEKSGELVNTVMTGIEQLETYIAKYLPQVALAALIPLAIWILVVGTDLWSAVILAVTAPLVPVFMILIGKGAQLVTDRQWKTLSLLSAHFLDVVRGLTTLKIFNRSKAQIQIIRSITENYRLATMKSLKIAFLSAFALELLTTLSVAMVAVALGLRLLSGHIDFYRAFVVLILAPDFYLPIRQIGVQFHASMNGISAAKRLFEILDTKIPGLTAASAHLEKLSEDVMERPGELPFSAKPNLNIEFEHVSLVYPGEEQPVLQDVTFSIDTGQTVAVVGATGAGKSTLFDLLLGFVRPTSGRILINKVPLDMLSIDVWRRMIGFVPQKSTLIEGSIFETIRMAKPEASLEEVRRAAQLAQADEFISRLPQGYNTPITEEAALSGGEIQRLAIARAVLRIQPSKDGPEAREAFLAMDEPTAQLDLLSENALQSALDEILPHCTALIVAHRLSTIVKADKVIVMDAGRVVQEGNHSALLKEKGLYRNLFAAYGSRGDLETEGLHNA